MKTFFSALILGIFVGSIITAYWSSPEAFEKLKESKSALLGQTDSPDEVDPQKIDGPSPESGAEPSPEVPVFKVAGPKVEQSEPKPEKEETKPLPTPAPPKPKPSEAIPVEEEEPNDIPTPVETDEPSEEEEEEKTPLDRGKEKAAEIAELAKEKAIELHEKAEPYLNEGVDLAIASAIRAQFKIDKRIDSEQLEIEVKNREVTLTGTVPDGKTKQVVIDIAMTTKGVMQVTPEIEIAAAE